MASPSPCPHPERLRQLLQEEASPPPGAGPNLMVESRQQCDQEHLLAHLAGCSLCQITLESLAGANPALLDVARTLRAQGFVEEPPLRRVLDRLGKDVNLTVLYSMHSGLEANIFPRHGRSPESAQSAGRLRGEGTARPGRHGRGVPGLRPGSEAVGGDQAAGARPGQRCGGPGAVCPGSPVGGRPAPRACRHHSHRQRGQRSAVPGHGVCRGRLAAGLPRPAWTAGLAGHRPARGQHCLGPAQPPMPGGWSTATSSRPISCCSRQPRRNRQHRAS